MARARVNKRTKTTGGVPNETPGISQDGPKWLLIEDLLAGSVICRGKRPRTMRPSDVCIKLLVFTFLAVATRQEPYINL